MSLGLKVLLYFAGAIAIMLLVAKGLPW